MKICSILLLCYQVILIGNAYAVYDNVPLDKELTSGKGLQTKTLFNKVLIYHCDYVNDTYATIKGMASVKLNNENDVTS